MLLLYVVVVVAAVVVVVSDYLDHTANCDDFDVLLFYHCGTDVDYDPYIIRQP